MRVRRAVGIALALAVVLPAVACSGGSAGAGHRSVTSTPSATAAAQPFPVTENKRPGTSAWRITDLGAADAINGGVAARAGFARSFDGEAVGELHQLRAGSQSQLDRAWSE